MTLTLHNTLTKHLDQFTPRSDKKVTLYTCGPTVYDRLHVGNWAAYIYWDILVRTLLAAGYTVERVMNITDVGHLVSDADDGEDKLEKGAKRESKTAWEVAEYYTEDFIAGMEKLGLLPPEHLVKATNFVTQQLDLVRTLKEEGYTYQTTDGIYFDTSKFSTYADFAHLDLDAQKAGARIELNSQKHQPWDFALWKFTPKNEKRDMEWATPADLLELPGEEVVMGFPGWHLECSAMAMSILGPSIDIHTGGIDHIPVHHTNEIAQSEAASGQQFARFWLHNNHIKIDGTKVSKSLGNTYSLQQLAERGFSPMDLKLFILQGHYSKEGNFTFENLQAAKNRLANWRAAAVLRHQTHSSLESDTEKTNNGSTPSLQAAIGAVREALMNDLNTPEALRIIDAAFDQLSTQPISSIHHHGLIELLEAVDELLGLQLLGTTPDISDTLKRILLERQRARETKNWKKSDELRDLLLDNNILTHDTPHGTKWSYREETTA